MKVLIIKLSSIGDVIHTLPSLQALKAGLGKKARIDWLVEEAASSVLKGHPLLDNVIVVKRGWVRNYRENLKAASMLSKTGYDIILDFQGLLKSGAWVRLIKGKRKIGFSNARELSHVFYTEKLPPFDIERHAVERYLDLARHAGGVAGEISFPLKTGARIKAGVEKKLRAAGVKGDFFAVVARARWETKLWEDSRFIEFSRKVLNAWGLTPVLVGGREDTASLNRMKEAIGEGCVNLSGQTDLNELAHVFRLSRFVVTVDSGPMHMAAASGARVIALFGPTAPWRTGPYGQGHTVIRKGLSCSPCFKKKCADPKCMKEITVEEVISAVKGVMGEAKKAR